MRTPVIVTSLLALVALVALVPSAQADVIKVPGDYVNLQVAVNNASDGDVILMQPTLFAGPVDIGDKSLTLVAESGAAITPMITIHDLSADKVVVLRGLSGDGVGFAGGPNEEGLVLTDNLGQIVIEGASYTGALGRSAVRINDSLHVSIAHCTLVAGGGARALDATGSDVAVSFSTLTAGGPLPPWSELVVEGSNGAAAVAIGEGRVYVTGSTLVGGDGGHGHCYFDGFSSRWYCGDGGNGGAGIFGYWDAEVWQHGNVFVPGEGQPGGDDSETTVPGMDGHALLLESGAVATTFAAPSRDTTVTGLRKEGQTGSLVFDGEPGDFAFVWIALAPRWELLPAYAGVFQVNNGAGFNLLLPVAPTGPSGTLSLSFVAPQLASGLDALTLHLQGIYRSSTGQFLLAPRTVLVVVDSAF